MNSVEFEMYAISIDKAMHFSTIMSVNDASLLLELLCREYVHSYQIDYPMIRDWIEKKPLDHLSLTMELIFGGIFVRVNKICRLQDFINDNSDGGFIVPNELATAIKNYSQYQIR